MERQKLSVFPIGHITFTASALFSPQHSCKWKSWRAVWREACSAVDWVWSLATEKEGGESETGWLWPCARVHPNESTQKTPEHSTKVTTTNIHGALFPSGRSSPQHGKFCYSATLLRHKVVIRHGSLTELLWKNPIKWLTHGTHRIHASPGPAVLLSNVPLGKTLCLSRTETLRQGIGYIGVFYSRHVLLWFI